MSCVLCCQGSAMLAPRPAFLAQRNLLALLTIIPTLNKPGINLKSLLSKAPRKYLVVAKAIRIAVCTIALALFQVQAIQLDGLCLSYFCFLFGLIFYDTNPKLGQVGSGQTQLTLGARM
ncbi:hypothetical protein Hanom_Chr06g00493621 [Helianthus anomalus]